MRLRTTKELSCQAWTVALSSLLAGVAGLTQVSVSVWLFVYTADFVPIIEGPIRNSFIGFMTLGGFCFLTAAFGACCAVMRNKIGLTLYGGFLVAAMICQAGLWTFVYLEERNITTMPEALQRRIMQNSDTVGEVLNNKFLCRLESFNNEVEELDICGETFSKWVNIISAVLWGLSAVSLCIEFITLVMVTMLAKLVYNVERRDKVELFFGAEVIEHSQAIEQKNGGQRNGEQRNQAGHRNEELQRNGGQRNGEELQRNGEQRNQAGHRNEELQRNGGQRNGEQRNQAGHRNEELQRNGGQRNGGQQRGQKTEGQISGGQRDGGQKHAGQTSGGQRNRGQRDGGQTSGGQRDGWQRNRGQRAGEHRNGGQRNGRQRESVVDLDNFSIYDHLGHIEVNHHCHTEQDQESIWL